MLQTQKHAADLTTAHFWASGRASSLGGPSIRTTAFTDCPDNMEEELLKSLLRILGQSDFCLLPFGQSRSYNLTKLDPSHRRVSKCSGSLLYLIIERTSLVFVTLVELFLFGERVFIPNFLSKFDLWYVSKDPQATELAISWNHSIFCLEFLIQISKVGVMLWK